MKVWTVDSNGAREGAEVARHELRGAGVSIDAILIGETGRGRELGVLPVAGFRGPKSPCPERGQRMWTGVSRCHRCGLPATSGEGNWHPLDDPRRTSESHSYGLHALERGEVEDRVLRHARVGETRSGDPELARGVIAQGDAGRAGSGEQWVLQMAEDTSAAIEIGGRLYGRPGSWVLEHRNGVVRFMTAEGADLALEARP